MTEKLAAFHELYNTDECVKKWGFRQFRVILLQTTEERRLNLLEELATTLPYRMFWLTTEDLYQDDIGGMIFKTPKDFNSAAYSLL